MQIGLNTYSLRKEWKKLGKDPFVGVLKFCVDSDICHLEILDAHFEPKNLPKIVALGNDFGITIGALAPHVKILVKPREVAKEIAEGKRWITLAHANGINFLRVQVGDGPLPKLYPPKSNLSEEKWAEYKNSVQKAVDFTEPVLNPLIEAAEKAGVYLGIETHHSYSSNYVYMNIINTQIASKHVGWIFDIGNFDDDGMRWKGLDEIKSRIFYIHSKSYEFSPEGLETTLDYPKVCQILHDVQFTGTWSIEYEGQMNGFIGAMKTNELIKYSIEKVGGQTYDIKVPQISGEELIKKYKN